jgi:hypothetical protein
VPELADHHVDDLAGFGSRDGGESGGTKLGDFPARQFGEPFEQVPSRGDGIKDRAAQVIHHRGIGREHLLHGRVAGGSDLRRGAGDGYLRDCLGEIIDDQLFNRVPKPVFRSEMVDK